MSPTQPSHLSLGRFWVIKCILSEGELRTSATALSGADATADEPERANQAVHRGGAALIVGISVGSAFLIGTIRDRTIGGAERELENTALLLARQFDQQLHVWQTIPNELTLRARSAELSTPEQFRGFMSGIPVHSPRHWIHASQRHRIERSRTVTI